MLQEFSEKLTAFFIQSNIIDESNRAWCQYIIEKKIMQLVNVFNNCARRMA